MEDGNKQTYCQYFEEKYHLKTSRLEQLMVEVRPITNILESIKPRPVSSSAKQKKRKKHDVPTYLPPEFVSIMPFPAAYWYKSILLPSILHRFHHLLLAEELRQIIVEEAGVGLLDITTDSVEEKKFFINSLNSPITNEPTEKTKKFVLKERTNNSTQVEKSVQEIEDIFRSENVTLNDVKKFEEYMAQPLFDNIQKVSKKRSNILCRDDFSEEINFVEFIDPPVLLTNQPSTNCQGPSQYEILQALTLRGADDTINLERHETLGDSLLKYLVSLSIFVRENKMNEGHLTLLKGRIIGNKYLFDCGVKHNIPSYVKGTKFSVDNSWMPPAFCVLPTLRSKLPQLTHLSALLQVTIPYNEQFSGHVSFETIDSIKETLKEFMQRAEDVKSQDELTALFLIGRHKLSHKSVADVVEALIGVYLQKCGIEGAFQVMKYFGILQKEDYSDLLATKIVTETTKEFLNSVMDLVPEYRKIEELFQYEFKNKSLILQAITHPSCLSNTLTDCYQKLEFIGDAVLDFLITSYIFQYCGDLSPGQITDLRSALVNNNTFGALAVRMGLNKFLLSHSKALEESIATFVIYQKSKNYKIYGNELLLINEYDTTMAEEVEVPKALGDIFESLVGAIFLDSGYDLNRLWKIYYNIMADEMKQFCAKVPINPIRALYEMNMKITFKPVEPVKEKSQEEDTKSRKFRGDKQLVHLCVSRKKESIVFTGKGINSAAAKRAAAKQALNNGTPLRIVSNTG